MTTDAKAQTTAEVLAVAAAIAGLGGKATPEQAAAAAGLPLDVVKKRLHQSGPSNPFPTRRYFARTGEVWGLTPTGLAAVQTPRAT